MIKHKDNKHWTVTISAGPSNRQYRRSPRAPAVARRDTAVGQKLPIHLICLCFINVYTYSLLLFSVTKISALV